MSGAGAILRLATIPRLRTRSPLSHAAGEGLGVRAALTFPLAPFRSHAAGAEGGGRSGAGAILRLATIPRLRTRSPLSRRAGKGLGVRAALTFPPGPLPLSPSGSGRGGRSGAGAILRLATIPRLRTRSPLSRRAGKGLGVRAALTFPPGPLPLSPSGSGRGRDERSRSDPAAGNDTAFAHQITPLPQGGRGAGGEGGPHLPPQPPSAPTLRERKGER